MEYNEGESTWFAGWKLNHESALQAHSRHSEEGRAVFTSALNMALEAIRTATAINGGAVIAIFAFLGATFNSDSAQTSAMRLAMVQPAFFFAAGALFSGIASGASYFSQILFSAAHSARNMTWESPFIASNEQSERCERWGDFWRAVAIALVFASYVSLVVGLVFVHSAMTQRGTI